MSNQMDDRFLAIKIRRILLSVIALIEQHYKLGKYEEADVQLVHEEDNVAVI